MVTTTTPSAETWTGTEMNAKTVTTVSRRAARRPKGTIVIASTNAAKRSRVTSPGCIGPPAAAPT